ncbi:venom dipeptidyl peptidase 4 [Trichonephila clavipes]|nr:venom dipeptidyl peptidase 4 [Trichonephila clavipes]
MDVTKFQNSTAIENQDVLVEQKDIRFGDHTALFLQNCDLQSPGVMLLKLQEKPKNQKTLFFLQSSTVFVKDSNMFYMPQFSSLTKPRPLTTNGENDVILNGVPDWVYEEEILGANNAIWWSDDGTKIAYACFNDSAVDFINLPKYGDYHDVTNLYPQFRRFRYPKVRKTL